MTTDDPRDEIESRHFRVSQDIEHYREQRRAFTLLYALLAGGIGIAGVCFSQDLSGAAFGLLIGESARTAMNIMKEERQ